MISKKNIIGEREAFCGHIKASKNWIYELIEKVTSIGIRECNCIIKFEGCKSNGN